MLPPPIQTTYVVDGSGGTPGAFTSITGALASSASGDTIQVKGMVDSVSNLPVGYTEINFFGGIGETFPLVVPSGVTIAGTSGPVYVYSQNASPPAAIFDLNTGVSQTRIGNLGVLGGAIGIKVHGGNADVLLQKITFSNNVVGFSSLAQDTSLHTLEITGCTFKGLLPSLANPPGSYAESVGLKFEADELTSGLIPRIEATVNNLASVGPFTGMGGVGSYSVSDLPFGNGSSASCLVQVLAQGDSQEFLSPLGVAQPIAEAVVSLNGGTLDGGPDPAHAGGWDIGVYSAIKSKFSGTSTNYTAATTVTLTGVVLEDFREAGVHGTANVGTRGIVNLRGQTTVQNTGSGLTHNTSAYPIHNGVHMFCIEGYLALSCDDSNFGNNLGSGVFLSCPGTLNQETTFDMGLFLGIRRSKMHLNGESGLELFSGVIPPSAPFFAQPGIVGGTWTIASDPAYSGEVLLVEGDASATKPYGQGVVDRCAISNNGRNGIHVRVEGDEKHYVFTRFVNNIIWNNEWEGFLSEIALASGEAGVDGVILTPLVHCTLAGNGDVTDATIEFAEPSSGGGTRNYAWIHPLGGNPIFGTEIVNTILQRKSSANADLGPNVDLVLGKAMAAPAILSPTQIGFGGVRFTTSSRIGALNAVLLPASTVHSTPYSVGSPTWTSLLASQFYLDPSGSFITSFKDATLTFFHLLGNEWGTDFSGNSSRPSMTTGTADKGAEEL